MPQPTPTETIIHNGTEYTIPFMWAMKCQKCGYITESQSWADRVSCSHCKTKTPRDEAIHGKYYTDSLKGTLFTGDESDLDTVIARLQARAEKYAAMRANGWTFDCTTRSGRVAFSKGDAPPQEITG